MKRSCAGLGVKRKERVDQGWSLSRRPGEREEEFAIRNQLIRKKLTS